MAAESAPPKYPSEMVRQHRRAASAVALPALCLALGACAPEDERPPRADFSSGGTPAAGGGPGIILPPEPTLPGCTGSERIRVLSDVPRLYFVLDRSASMAQALGSGSRSKWQSAQAAVTRVLRAIGHRVEYAAAVFPSIVSACAAGREVFPFTQGDPPTYAASGTTGPILQDLVQRLAVIDPVGGTPTAATLAAVHEKLEGVSVRSAVVLATDGAPNCNPEAECTSAACIPDLEGAVFGANRCGVDASCCDAKVLGPGAGSNCVDEAETLRAIESLAASGIPTYVIGLPGAEPYAAVLDRLAHAGGTARDGDTAYYAVSDAPALERALFEIGTGVAITCDLALANKPAKANLVNVFFDGEPVPQNPDNGWDWDSETTLSLRGEACTHLRSGNVLTVDVTYGCLTIVE